MAESGFFKAKLLHEESSRSELFQLRTVPQQKHNGIKNVLTKKNDLNIVESTKTRITHIRVKIVKIEHLKKMVYVEGE